MPRKRNDESGQYRETVRDGEILDFIEGFDRPFITANDLIEHFEIGRTRANDRLNQLASDGELKKTSVGAHAVVWWLSKTHTDAQSWLKRLSTELGEAIIVDDTVYEAGDSHPLDASESGESVE